MEEHQSVGRTAAELTFWTLCPYCFHAHEYGKAYEECCLRCANCRRGFHAAAVQAPPEAEQHNGAGGVGYYNCHMGVFPLRYVWCAQERGEEEMDVVDYLVEISSDADEGWESAADWGRVKAGSEGGGEGTKEMEVEVEEERRRREDSCGGGLEFEYEEDDILVSA